MSTKRRLPNKAETMSTKRRRPDKAETMPDNLEAGELILALDRLYGGKRAKKMAVYLGEREVFPVPSCAALEIMKLENKVSVLLNALHRNDMIWCSDRKEGLIRHQFQEHPIFETYCDLCRGKITVTPRDVTPLVAGHKRVTWVVHYVGTIMYRCETMNLVCMKCKPALDREMARQQNDVLT